MSACQKLQIECENPRLFPIQNDRDFRNWEQEAKSSVNPKVQFVMFVLEGKKNAGAHYKELKKLFIETMPCATQMVLKNTIANAKNLFSIVIKIVIQIQAKLGAIPWATTITDLDALRNGSPSDATMVCGYDVFHKRNNPSVMAFTSTLDAYYCKYWQTTLKQQESQEFADCL